jgi:DNA-binding transcriptional LysR family regulator
MHAMNWGAFDLNLLVVFDAVMRERSVKRAAQQVGLSQPAVSHALARLRHMLKDELLVRTPTGMAPTPRAEQLAGPVRHALEEMQLALEPEAFVPARAERRFAVAVDNCAAIVVAPVLVGAAATAAPGVRLDLRPSGTLDIEDLIDRGELDLAIGRFSADRERFIARQLFADAFVAVLRRSHPSVRRPLSAETLAQLPELEISSSGDDTGFLDHWLAERRLARRIAHRAPYLSTARLLAESDLVAIVRRRVAEVLVASGGLQTVELPCPSPKVVTAMLWHRRLDAHPAHRWLRTLVTSTAADATSGRGANRAHLTA